MIFVAAGHYPSRPGVCIGSFCEHDEAQLWVNRVVELMTGAAMAVPFDVTKNKLNYINARSPSAAIEIHFNAAQRKGQQVGQGSQTLFLPANKASETLAHEIQSRLGSVFRPDLGIVEGYYRGDANNGPDYFLAACDCPSVIVLPEFIHRKQCIESLREDGCRAIAEGLFSFSIDKTNERVANASVK